MKVKEVLKEMVTSSAVAPDAFPMKLFTIRPIVIDTYMKMLKKKKKRKLNEDLQTVKFFYKNWHSDKFPKVLVLDTEYKGRPGQSTYGQRDDVLGWNVNYFENKEEAVRTINDIDTFARMISVDKEEKYKRVRYFFPEQSSYIRRYSREFIRGLKAKEDYFWKPTTFDEIKIKDKDFS